MTAASAPRARDILRRFLGITCLAGALSVSGCVFPDVPNAPLQRHDAHAGYRLENLPPSATNTDEVFICLAFSGGGTRAAALSYGVLEELHETAVSGGGRTLYDEVDVVSSVSGGSFTALAMAHFGPDLFDHDQTDGRGYKARFLYRDIQSVLLRTILNPANLIQLPFVALDRTDLAAEVYDHQLFDRATYGDLLQRRTRPFVVVNSTRVARGHRVEFTQDDFDLLGSDLASVPLGWAAAASSAYPFAFSPIRLRYYANEAANTAARSATRPDSEGHTSPRRSSWAKELLADQADLGVLNLVGLGRSHRFLHLFDAGVSDNTGLHHVFESTFGGAISRKLGSGSVKHFVVIAVNAGVSRGNTIERLPTAPGLLTMFMRTAEAPIDVNTSFSISAARFRFEEHANQVCEVYTRASEWRKANCPDGDEIEAPGLCNTCVYFIELSLSDIPDDDRRADLMNIRTSLFLKDDEVDKVVRAGRDLLRNHARFRELLKNLSENE